MTYCWAIALSVTRCFDVILCRRTVACGNCVISVIQLSPSLDLLTPLSRSSNGIVQTTTAPQIHHHSSCATLVER